MTLTGALALSGCGKETTPAETSSPNDVVAPVEAVQGVQVDAEVPIASGSKEVCGLGPILRQEAEVCRETIEFCWERGDSAIERLRDTLLTIPPGEEQKSIEQRRRTFQPMVDLVENAIRDYRGAQYFDGEVSKKDGARLRVNERIELDIDLEIARMHCLRLRGLISKDFLSPTQKDALWEQAGSYWKTFYEGSKVKWRNVQMAANLGRLYAATLDAFVVIDSANGEGFNELLTQAEAGIQTASGKAESYEGRRYFEQMFVLVSKKWRAYDAFRDMMSVVDDGIRFNLANRVASECNAVLEIKLSEWNKDLLDWREDTVVACCQLAEAAGTADRLKGPNQKLGVCKQSKP